MSKEAVDRLREKAQNAQTVIALSDLLQLECEKTARLTAALSAAEGENRTLQAHIGVLRGELQKIAAETDAALEHSDYQLSMRNIAAIITRFRQENGHEQEEATLPSRQKIPLQGMPR